MADQIHSGHREKMRKRFIRDKGFENFEDHQILELLLFYANTRSDTNPLAHELLDAFGSLKGVLEARPEQLMQIKGIGEQQATLISMVVPLTRVWHRCAMTVPDRIGNSREAENYCLSILAGERTERFYVVCMNAKCNVLGQRRISMGSLSEVSANPRLVLETALNYNAHSILLCHNHPGVTCISSSGLELISHLKTILIKDETKIPRTIKKAYSRKNFSNFSAPYKIPRVAPTPLWYLRLLPL